MQVKLEEVESIVDTDFGPLFMGYKAVATAEGELNLSAEGDEGNEGKSSGAGSTAQ